MINLKLLLIQASSLFAMILLNSIMVYVYYTHNYNNMISSMNGSISINFIMSTLMMLYVLKINMDIPYFQYDPDSDDETFQQNMGYEMTDISVHIMLSIVLTITYLCIMRFVL